MTNATLPTSAGSREVLHPNAFDAGPRITRIDYVRMPSGAVVAVDVWTQNGAPYRVTGPRALHPGETAPA